MARTRADAAARDAADPLAALRDAFVIPGDDGGGDDLVYLDGNSLGRPARATVDALDHLVGHEWARGLVESWETWIDLPIQVGDELGSAFLGAAPGQVVVCDNVTTNLYKAVRAAQGLRPGRTVVVTDPDDFPTDRYVVAAIADELGALTRAVPSDIDHGFDADTLDAVLDDDVSVVCLSLVGYRSGAFADLAAVTQRVHDAGALIVWDCSHAVGAVPIALDAAGVDLAVGCTYKYLDAGPGAPAFLYAATDLQPQLRNPIQGWMAQREQFAMGDTHDPAPGIRRFLTGTPAIPGLVAVRSGVGVLADAGIDALRAKSVELCGLLVDLHDERLAPLGFRLASPREPDRRGGHVTLEHPHALGISQALRRRGVVADHRVPDRLRLGPAPAYTRFVDMWDAIDAVVAVVASGEHLEDPDPVTVT